MPSKKELAKAKRRGVNPYAIANAKCKKCSKAKKERMVKAITKSTNRKRKKK